MSDETRDTSKENYLHIRLPQGVRMRIGLAIVGAILLLAGIVLEGFYFVKSQLVFYGTIVSQNTYLMTGAVFIIAGYCSLGRH